MEGDGLIAPIFNFFLRLGNVTWDQDHTSGFVSEFRAFLLPPTFAFTTRSDTHMGFDVHAGTLTSLRGVAISAADDPFIEFSVPGIGGNGSPGSFFAFAGFAVLGNSIIGRIQAVPEPATVAILGIGLAGLGFSRGRTLRSLTG